MLQCLCETRSFEIDDVFVALRNNRCTKIQLSKWDMYDKVRDNFITKCDRTIDGPPERLNFSPRRDWYLLWSYQSQERRNSEKLWHSMLQCCRWKGETWKFGFIIRIDKASPNVFMVVELPPWKIWKADVSSVSLRQSEWGSVGGCWFYEGVEDSVLHALCAQFTLSFVFLVFLKRCNLEAMSVLELLSAVKKKNL